ncbi:hypothetical protein [Arhodomonas sp. SL1]|uniref:hypothetical protein n=1 Tax=Arhodomonas sp. SL1 TaxID=3425691 RepID=UPI003F881A32
MTALRPFELARELVAGLAGAGIFLAAHYLLTFPHWGWRGVVDTALAVVVALLLYAGIRLAWSTRPGVLERWLGLEVPLRPSLADDDPDSLREALHFTVDAARPRVSEPLQQQLDRIVEAVEAVLAAGGGSAAGREAAYTLRATVTEYVPDTLERYLRLPRRFATRKAVRDGKTARDLAVEQLSVLAGELEAIAEEVHRGNAAELAAHGRFLDERFSRQDPLRHA